MPNYYAHLEFGRHVLESLPLPLRRSIEREKTAFLLGLLGPDPLFFLQVVPAAWVWRCTGSPCAQWRNVFAGP